MQVCVRCAWAVDESRRKSEWTVIVFPYDTLRKLEHFRYAEGFNNEYECVSCPLYKKESDTCLNFV